MSQANQPTDHQSLFRWAINQRVKVIGEFLPRQASWQLWAWARWYAKQFDLDCPTAPDEFGIYYPPDDEEETELKELGLLPEDWEATKSNEELWW